MSKRTSAYSSSQHQQRRQYSQHQSQRQYQDFSSSTSTTRTTPTGSASPSSFYQHHQHASHRSHKRSVTGSSAIAGHRSVSVNPSMTHKSTFAVVVAVVAIALFHFRGPIRLYLRGLWDRPMEQLSWTVTAGISLLWYVVGLLTSISSSFLRITTGADGSDENGSIAGDGLMRRSGRASSRMPGLDIPKEVEDESKETMSASRATRQVFCPDVEPSFRKPEDFPDGWLVYHRVLGVVDKREADAYDEKMARESSQEPT